MISSTLNQYHFNYKGKTAVVVGGSRGIGREVTIQLLNAGADVHYISRTEGDISLDGAVHHKCDLNDPSDLKILFSKDQSLNCADFLINCAAVNFCKSSLDISLQEWEEVFSVNLTSLFIACQSVLPYMMSKKVGKS